MIDIRSEAFKKLNEEYQAIFGERIPTMMIPLNGTIEEFQEKIEESKKTNRNIFAESYGWNDLDNVF